MELLEYFHSTLDKNLEELTSDSQAKWGILTPHHMVEHLIWSLRLSTGKLEPKLEVPEEEIPLRLKFLNSIDEIPIDDTNNENKILFALKTSSLDEAKIKLTQEKNFFLEKLSEEPGFENIHPLFGKLNMSLWAKNHVKHFIHHFKQFGITRGIHYLNAIPHFEVDHSNPS